MNNAPALELDHLIVAARTLEEGARHVNETLGVEPVAGGAHKHMGTHNRLLGLWGGIYLEIIAIDPDASPPPTPDGQSGTARPRWFALDDPAMQARLAEGPFLAHWALRVARPRDLTRWQNQYPTRIAPVVEMTRGELRWRLTVPESGGFPSWQGVGEGILPSLIQWDTPVQPSDRLPASGLALKRLKARHPRAAAVREQLEWLGAEHLVELDEATDGTPALAAEIETPAGVLVLR